MTLTIHIPAELEIVLLERAKAASKSPEELAVETLKDWFADESVGAAVLPTDAWLAEFRAFTAATPRGNVHANVSRDSIYQGRGE
jgi:hypothetical protein